MSASVTVIIRFSFVVIDCRSLLDQFNLNSNDVLSPSKSENIALFSIPCRSAAIHYFPIITSEWRLQPLLHLNLVTQSVLSAVNDQEHQTVLVFNALVILSSAKIKAAMDLPPILKSGFSFGKLFCFRSHLLSDAQGLRAQLIN